MDCDYFRWNQIGFDGILIDGLLWNHVEIFWIMWNWMDFMEFHRVHTNLLGVCAKRCTQILQLQILLCLWLTLIPNVQLLSRREMGKTELTNLLNPLSHFTSSLSGEVSENDCNQWEKTSVLTSAARMPEPTEPPLRSPGWKIEEKPYQAQLLNRVEGFVQRYAFTAVCTPTIRC